jgi:hypothetical protein
MAQIWWQTGARSYTGPCHSNRATPGQQAGRGSDRLAQDNLALLRYHHWWQVDTAISDATLAIHRVLRDGGWTPPQRPRQLGPGTWHPARPGMLSAGPDHQDDGFGDLAVAIAIYPDVVRLAARSLRRQDQAPFRDLGP